MNPTHVADLTVDELIAIVKQAVREANMETNGQTATKNVAIEKNDVTPAIDQSRLADIPVISVGKLPEGLKLLSREEYYNDDGR